MGATVLKRLFISDEGTPRVETYIGDVSFFFDNNTYIKMIKALYKDLGLNIPKHRGVAP